MILIYDVKWFAPRSIACVTYNF